MKGRNTMYKKVLLILATVIIFGLWVCCKVSKEESGDRNGGE